MKRLLIVACAVATTIIICVTMGWNETTLALIGSFLMVLLPMIGFYTYIFQNSKAVKTLDNGKKGFWDIVDSMVFLVANRANNAAELASNPMKKGEDLAKIALKARREYKMLNTILKWLKTNATQIANAVGFILGTIMFVGTQIGLNDLVITFGDTTVSVGLVIALISGGVAPFLDRFMTASTKETYTTASTKETYTKGNQAVLDKDLEDNTLSKENITLAKNLVKELATSITANTKILNDKEKELEVLNVTLGTYKEAVAIELRPQSDVDELNVKIEALSQEISNLKTVIELDATNKSKYEAYL